MYELLKLSGTLKSWQVRYCQADFCTCARYQLSDKGQPVPQNLMPNGALLRLAGKVSKEI
jgi:hypothetical protein